MKRDLENQPEKSERRRGFNSHNETSKVKFIHSTIMSSKTIAKVCFEDFCSKAIEKFGAYNCQCFQNHLLFDQLNWVSNNKFNKRRLNKEGANEEIEKSTQTEIINA